jgi:hypothetical protein
VSESTSRTGRAFDPSTNGHHADEAAIPSYCFKSWGDFMAHEYPHPTPLLGGPGAVYIGAGTLFMAYGDGGAGKSTFAIDGAAHLSIGRDWLGIPVPRPVPTLMIENEGAPGLVQAKLARKAQSWGVDGFPNIHVFAEPWGNFSFAKEHARRELTGYCDANGIELVIANPTLGLGAAASGRPDETGQFVEWLRECGLWSNRAFWPLHHLNKAKEVSGDWERHLDTSAFLEEAGRERTKLTWRKHRWISPKPAPLMLDWVVETEGYEVTSLDTAKAPDDVLVERLKAHLEDHPLTATTHVLKAVEGEDGRLDELLKTRPEFDEVPGRGTTKLWKLSSSAEAETQ